MVCDIFVNWLAVDKLMLLYCVSVYVSVGDCLEFLFGVWLASVCYVNLVPWDCGVGMIDGME